MIKSLKILSALLPLIAVFIFFISPAVGAFDPFGRSCSSDKAKNSPTCQQNTAQEASNSNPVLVTINHAVDLIALITGAVAVIVIIGSGIMIITSGGVAPGQRGGDPNKIKSARAALTGAVIGLAVLALSWTIITFVIDRVIQ